MSIPAGSQQSSASRDLLVVAGVTLLTFALSSAFDLREWVEKFTGPFEAYQVDELPLTLLAMALALAWFSWRRSKQAMEQMALRLGSEEQYRMLFMETLAGNLLASSDGTIKLANPAAAQLLGFDSAEQMNGHPLGEFYFDRNNGTCITACCLAAARSSCRCCNSGGGTDRLYRPWRSCRRDFRPRANPSCTCTSRTSPP